MQFMYTCCSYSVIRTTFKNSLDKGLCAMYVDVVAKKSVLGNLAY